MSSLRIKYSLLHLIFYTTKRASEKIRVNNNYETEYYIFEFLTVFVRYRLSLVAEIDKQTKTKQLNKRIRKRNINEFVIEGEDRERGGRRVFPEKKNTEIHIGINNSNNNNNQQTPKDTLLQIL